MRVIVCGGRDYNDGDHIWNTLTRMDAERSISCVIHGAAKGADTHAMLWAQMMPECVHAPFQADWFTYGKTAGPRRNQRMMEEGKPDLVIAFPGGRGTADMVSRAKKAGVEVMEIPARATVGEG